MTTQGFEHAFAVIGKLAAAFEANYKFFVSSEYSEAQARIDFVDKFFVALGWDVNHERTSNPFEQEVKVERAVSGGAAERRVDYAFHVAPNFRDARFIAEAKKPHGELATAENYFQMVRYGWNLQNPLAGLTDFEHFHLLDCRYKPDIDTALHRCLEKWSLADYLDREKFARLYWLVSREAVDAGSLEKYAADLPKPRGKSKQRGLFSGAYKAFDEAFLEDLDLHRNTLARAFKKHNPDLDSEALTDATQRTLDRLVFMRFLEDKLIEPSRFVANFGERGTAWQDFIAASRRLDRIYNGIVFKKDDLLDAPGFRLDEPAFAGVCEDLSHINSPYDFNAIPIHILGSIYERFLGNVIVATEKRVRVEPKPEVRKAGGVFYTPEYIVRYIAENTVGKLIEGKTPEQIADLRFVDIACGSGSFLLGVYDLLLRYHAQYYNAHPREAQRSNCTYRDSVYYLTVRQKREILLNNIYGVDLDNQAVEVTQLSLYLKLLDDETIASARNYQLTMHTAILPPLDDNIHCGNSLINWDITKGDLFPEEREAEILPMDYRDAFPKVMKRGGFDAVVGNPPYIRMEGFKEVKDYLRATYAVHAERSDLYAYFIERAHRLLRPGGVFGMILSNKFLRANYGKPLRDFLAAAANIDQIVDFAGLPVFPDATVRPIILLTSQPRVPEQPIRYSPPLSEREFEAVRAGTASVAQAIENTTRTVPTRVLQGTIWNFTGGEVAPLVARLQQNTKPLGEYCEGQICRGIVSGLTEAFVIDGKTRAKILRRNKRAEEIIKPFLNGRDIRRYCILPKDQYLIYTYHGVPIENYPAVEEHLLPFKKQLQARATRQPWYELQQPQYNFAPFMDGPKIIFPDIATKPRFALDESGFYGTNTTYFIPRRDLFLLGLLNSRVATAYFVATCAGLEGKKDVYLRFFGQYLEGFPVPVVNDASVLARLVEKMTETQTSLATGKSARDKRRMDEKVKMLDRQIDELVYELYGLTQEEVEIVEAATK